MEGVYMGEKAGGAMQQGRDLFRHRGGSMRRQRLVAGSCTCIHRMSP